MAFASLTRWSLRTAALIGLVGLMGWGAGATRGDDPDSSDKGPTKTSTKSSAKPSSGADAADAKDPFEVPEGRPGVLFGFINKMRQMHPPHDASADEKQEFLVKTHTAMVEAADKLLAGKPTGLARTNALKAKVEALVAIDKITKDGKAHQGLGELANEFKDDKQIEVVRLVKPFIGFAPPKVVVKAVSKETSKEEKPADGPATWADLKPKFVAAPENRDLLNKIVEVLRGLEQSGHVDEAVKAYGELSPIVAKSKDPQIAASAKRWDGMVRRLTMMGKPIEISGNLVDGTPVDLEALKGKVVLIDFWATWCGPCKAELPNVLANYEKYHSKGFEVIGVSVDSDKGALTKFIADQKLPWPIIFGAPPQGPAMASFYGIAGIPTAILTNEKGEVISLNARGPALTQKLEQLLGK